MSSRHAHWGERANRKPSATVDVGDRILIDAPQRAVWARLADVNEVAQCLPGLMPGTLERVGLNVYKASLEHSAMGLTARWELQATMELSEPDQRLHVLLAGDDSRLGMTMKGTATVLLGADPSGSVINYTAQVRIEGSLAGVGGPIIRSMVGDSLDRFVAAVSGRPDAPMRPRNPWRRLAQWVRRRLARASP